ncbi:hypothetical protein C1645_880736 [Glomus cerebriforme]|uniref:Galactose oxidase n=1 Tax=Glomus cerebriforme TaxID=658196 RepID=A0A397SE77_9GLOM|nr:hypothetical protein C1645_880736 [Glomus cerebriforme]
MVSFKPNQRTLHTVTLINDKLYIIGGNSSTGMLNDFFYLDVSASFNTQNLSWVDLSSTNAIVPQHYGAASVKGGANNDTLFLYGGFTTELRSPLYTFDTQTNLWNIPTMAKNIPRKSFLTGIIDNNGKMYLWGRLKGALRGPNDMLIIDTINLSLSSKMGSLSDAPILRYNYGATLLPNNNIIYMGGFYVGNLTVFPLDTVHIYNTINNSWYSQITTGKVPSSRDGFSVILGLDGQSVIIFGAPNLTSEDTLYELNLSNFEWYIPKISNTSQIPKGRTYHKANIIGKYMVISFGFGYDQSESDILLLDISNKDEYVWSNTFEPPVIPVKSVQAKNFTGIIIGSSIGITLLSFGGLFILYKWNKKKQKQKNLASIPHILSDC